MHDRLDDTVREGVLAFLRKDQCLQALGIEVAAIGPGEATLTMVVRNDMLNGHGTCHGGIIFTLADATFALASNSRGRAAVAQFCSIAYMRPVGLDSRLQAVGAETVQSGQRGVYDITVRCGDEVVAAFRGHARTIDERGGG